MSTATRGSPAPARRSAGTRTETSAASSARLTPGSVRDRAVFERHRERLHSLARADLSRARLVVTRPVRQQARVDLERPGEVLLLAQQPAELEQHLPLPRQVGLQHGDRGLAIVAAGEHPRERQPDAGQLGRRHESGRVRARRRFGVAPLERCLGLGHAPVGQLQLQGREPLAHDSVVGRHGRGSPVEIDRRLELSPPHGERAHADERRHVLRALLERRGEGFGRGGHLAGSQPGVPEAAANGSALGVAAQQLVVALRRRDAVARQDFAPGELQRSAVRLVELARLRRRVDVLLPLRQRGCDPLRARAERERPGDEREHDRAPPHASCSRYRSSARSGSSASSSTCPSSTSCVSTRPAA